MARRQSPEPALRDPSPADEQLPTVGGAAARDVTGSPSPAVVRAAAILDALAAARGAVGLAELSRSLGLPKSSTANLCVALEAAGLVSRTDAGLRLGRKTVELGGAYLAGLDQVQEFYDLCAASAHLSAETARIAVLDGLDVLYLARYDGRQPLRLSAGIGDRFPASCTATGKALLALLPDAVLDDRLSAVHSLPQLTAKSVSTTSQLRAEVERTRTQGYGVDDEETTPGVICLAIASRGRRTDSTPLAVSATVLAARLDAELREHLLAELGWVAGALGNPMLPG